MTVENLEEDKKFYKICSMQKATNKTFILITSII